MYERALEASERVLGAEHPDTLCGANNLASLLEGKGDYAGAKQLYERACAGFLRISRATGQPHPRLQATIANYHGCLSKMEDYQQGVMSSLQRLAANVLPHEPAKTDARQRMTPEQLRGNALEHYERGEFERARQLLEALLLSGFEVVSTRLHLARIALIMDRSADAGQHVAEAWARRHDAKPYVVARILWMRALMAILDGTDCAPFHGAAKERPGGRSAQMGWTMQPVLDHLKPRLTADDHALLSGLIAALGDRTNVEKLNAYPNWRDVAPRELE